MWGATCTWGPFGRRYLFSHPKCEAQRVPEAWPVVRWWYSRFSARQYCNAGAAAGVPAGVPAAGAFISNRSLAVFAFLIAKMVTRGQQLVKPVVHTCFRFFACKNCNTGTAAGVPAAGAFLSNRFLAVFVFLIAKIVTRGQQLVRPVVRTCFRFSPHKNRIAQNMRCRSLYSLKYLFSDSKC